MDGITVAAIFTGLVVLSIAFPQNFMPAKGQKKIKVKATYWGRYKEQRQDTDNNELCIEHAPSVCADPHLTGSKSYAAGRTSGN